MNKFQWSFLLLFITAVLSGQSITERVELAEQALEKNQIKEGIRMYQDIDSLARIAQDSFGITMSARVLGDYYNMIGQFDRARVLFEYALPFVSTGGERGQLLHGLSSAVDDTDGLLAEQYLLQAIAELELYDDHYELAIVYGNYGKRLVKMGRFEEAIEYYKKALGQNPNAISRIQLNMALSEVLILTENWDAAEEYILSSIEIAEDNVYKMRNGMPGVDYARWLIYKERFLEAQEELDKSIVFFEERDQEENLAQTYFVKALLFVKQKHWAKAKEILNSKDDIVKDFSDHRRIKFLHLENYLLEQEGSYQAIVDNGLIINKLIKDYKLPLLEKKNAHWLSLAYSKLGKSQEAFKFLELKEALSDSLYRSGQAKTVSRLEAEFKRKEQTREIENLEFKNSTKNKMLLGSGVFMLLLSIFSWLVYRLWRKVSTQKIVISSALKEKDILLREIHHRVKNNLQLVSSLLTLQIDSVSDTNAQAAIKEGHSRVQSMALIHQDLYHKENPTEVSGKVYLEKLTRELFTTYNIDPDRIKLKLDIEDLNIDVDILVPLGLIINELLTNALKYAFPEERQGSLDISLIDRDGVLDLWIKDDGIGFKPNEVRTGSFGTTLINALIAQLDGKISTTSSDGTQTNIVIDNYSQKR